MCWLLSKNVDGALVSGIILDFSKGAKKDLFAHYYQRTLLDAYLLPFLSNL